MRREGAPNLPAESRYPLRNKGLSETVHVDLEVIMPLGTLYGNDSVSQFKTVMYKKLKELGTSDFDRWERSVFEACTGRPREDVDWKDKTNRRGYKLWVQSFHFLADELLREGDVRIESADRKGRVILTPVDRVPGGRRPANDRVLN